MRKTLGSYCEIQSQKPKTKHVFCGTLFVQNRCVDIYECYNNSSKERLYAFDGIVWCKINEQTLMDVISWAEILDWRLRKLITIVI